jgi:ABC-2 type transport system permease protein
MSKVFVVVRAEYRRAILTRGFILSALLTPALVFAAMWGANLAEESKDVTDQRFAVVDATGALYLPLSRAAERRTAEELTEAPDADAAAEGEAGGGRRVLPAYVPERVEAPLGPDTELQLSERVRAGELVGFLLVGPALLDSGAGEGHSLEWHTDRPNARDLPRWIEQALGEEVRRVRFAEAGVDRELVRDLNRREEVRVLGLARRGDDGALLRGEESNVWIATLVPMGLMALLFMMVFSSLPMLMNGVLEEKTQKIAEVLVSAVPPFELMLGKMLAAALVTMTLSVLYLGSTLIALSQIEQVPPAVMASLGPEAIAWFAVFLVVALLIFGAVFAALGAACSDPTDAQSLVGPVMLLCFIPALFLEPLLDGSNALVPRLVSHFPPAVPMLMFVRVLVPPGVPWWELLICAAITGTFVATSVWAGAKVFRIGLLAQGQAPTWRTLMQWVLSK